MSHIKNMYDIRLKPRLLRSLIKDYLPEEYRHPTPNPHELSYLVDTLKTFRLLSEAFPDECSSEVVENWTAAVDEWIERLLVLVNCEMVNSTHRHLFRPVWLLGKLSVPSALTDINTAKIQESE